MATPPIDEMLVKLDKIQDHFRKDNRKTFKKGTRTVEVDCDTDKLYHHDLGVAIQYLVDIKYQYPKASLDECWTGYEDMYLRFIYEREETDDEYYGRLESEYIRLERERIIHDEHVRKDRIRKQIKKLQDQL